ncbi:PREDICTED: armadillo repeat-containing protein 7 [Papilio xuthus]|uniref:Armadillo repeat-containing protein 7 n=1 Tax=Papilio xuthus TaxID=66420 RepID=A0AAJ6Z8B1_PAPXU|nr:PREDICTED: armadillo repeat-containing protein 7 [Papilio xuthus]
MFSTKSQLRKRTPENGTDRENYLSLLVDEYLNSSSLDAKCQVLANLANFAYDPINYCFIRDVGALDIFLYVLKNESNDKLVNFACGGISNLCLDPLNTTYILDSGILNLVPRLLKSGNTGIVASTLSIIIQIHNSLGKPELFNSEIIQNAEILKSSEEKVIANLATVFHQDVCKLS